MAKPVTNAAEQAQIAQILHGLAGGKKPHRHLEDADQGGKHFHAAGDENDADRGHRHHAQLGHKDN